MADNDYDFEYEEESSEEEPILEKWDIVKCVFCGKEISMLTATYVTNGFSCRGGCKYGR